MDYFLQQLINGITLGSIYGLISCVAIIVLSKLIGKLWLMKGEDYYDS